MLQAKDDDSVSRLKTSCIIDIKVEVFLPSNALFLQNLFQTKHVKMGFKTLRMV